MGTIHSSHASLPRPSGNLVHWKPHWPRHYASKARPTQQAHPALFCYDVLVDVFAALDLDDQDGLTACAHSAQVCWAWSDPASQALWTSCSGRSLKDLYQLLRAVDVSLISELLSLNAFHHRRDAWALFLYCGSQIRALKCSHHDWRDDPAAAKGAEGVLIRSLVHRNHGRTFLPSLESAEWHEYPETRGALFSLVPPSLGSLNLTLHSTMTQHDIETFMAQLSSSIPGLHTLHLTTAPRVSVDQLSYPPHLHHLSLDASRIVLSPAELQTLVSCLKTVETLSVRIAEDRAWHEGVRLGTALRVLHLEGGCLDLAALVSRLHAPSLRELDIRVKEGCGYSSYCPKGHHQLAIELGRNTRLARTLHSLSLRYSTSWCPGSLGFTGPPVVLFTSILEPLLVHGLTMHLETLIVEYWHRAVRFTDDEVLRLAQACPELKRLTLSLGARTMCLQPPTTLPSLVALRDVAEHCPRLTYLEVDVELARWNNNALLASELSGLRPLPGADGMLEHHLQTLELTIRTLVDWNGEGDEVRARDAVLCYANKIFSHRYRDKAIVFVNGLTQ